mgnify:CR=1 FL=1
MIMASILYIVLGCFLDTTSMMIVTLPFLFPVVTALDINPIWFGIVLVKLIEISVVTPPVGINLFAVLGAVGGRGLALAACSTGLVVLLGAPVVLAL